MDEKDGPETSLRGKMGIYSKNLEKSGNFSKIQLKENGGLKENR